jgi:regulator of sigma E protease
MSYVLTFAVISAIILIHEAGHFISARAAGIPVEVFSIGFGPVLLEKRFFSTNWRLSLIPLGGYVLPAVEDEFRFFAIHPLRRMILSAGGPLFNILAAFFFLVAAGFQSGSPLGTALIRGSENLSAQIQSVFTGLSMIFTHPAALSGLVGIVHAGGTVINKGMSPLILASLLSVNLGIFNLLPIPPLDGAKMILTGLELINRRATRLQIPFAFAGWAIMIVLLGVTLYFDIRRMIA